MLRIFSIASRFALLIFVNHGIPVFGSREASPVLQSFDGDERHEGLKEQRLRYNYREDAREIDYKRRLEQRNSYERIHNLFGNVHRDACVNKQILKGENKKEPDVHICLENIFSPTCVVYSIGIADNWIFDDFMVSKGCQVFSFDPSMEIGTHKRHKNHLFEPIGIGVVSGAHKGNSTLYGGKEDYEVLTLSEMMRRHNHSHVDIVRMDTEYAEWDVLEQWYREDMFSKMNQLLLEVHMWPKSHHHLHNGELHSQLLHGIPMTLFHVARNKWDTKKLSGDMTSVYEVSFLRL